VLTLLVKQVFCGINQQVLVNITRTYMIDHVLAQCNIRKFHLNRTVQRKLMCPVIFHGVTTIREYPTLSNELHLRIKTSYPAVSLAVF